MGTPAPEGGSMSSFDIDLDDPPERWRELYAWLEAAADGAAPPSARAASPEVPREDPGSLIAIYAAYLAGEI
jgi:hypothetical protein